MQPLPARSIFYSVMASIVALAWLALWSLDHSPWGGHLHHSGLAALDASTGLESLLIQTGFYVTGWVLMTIAMMLPTTIPLLDAFRRMTRQRADHSWLVVLIIAGYLGTWLAFGILAHVFDYALHELFEQSSLLQTNSWLFAAGPLLLAGLFQFSKLKHRCLERCRAPVGFIIEHWRGGHPGRQALAIGAHHGLFCIGCCWALMLLMFAVGTGNLLWMLGLGAVMAVEKNLYWGRHLSTPLGVGLILWSVAIALDHSWTWQ